MGQGDHHEGARPRGLHHASLPVTDLERSVRFYEDVLGLRRIPRPDFPFAGAWFALGDTQQLHLIVHDAATLRAGGVDGRDIHVALRVDDHDATVAHLRAMGYDDALSPNDPMAMIAAPTARAGFPQIFILDPDRHVIELNSPPG